MAALEEPAVRRRGRCQRPQGLYLRQSPRSSAREGEQPRYVLSRGRHHSLRVYPPEPPEPEAPHPVPLLGLPEHGLNPHPALAQCLLVGCGPSRKALTLSRSSSSKLRISTRPLSPGVHSGFRGQALQFSASARYLLLASRCGSGCTGSRVSP